MDVALFLIEQGADRDALDQARASRTGESCFSHHLVDEAMVVSDADCVQGQNAAELCKGCWPEMHDMLGGR